MSLVGERKALAAAVLAMYTLMYLVNALFAPAEELKLLFVALSSLYGLAFFSLVAGYFWARWFAIGLGLFGVTGAIMAMVQIGVDYTFLFYGGTHALVSLFLWGNKMSTDFDGRTEWRERFHLDESATRRLGKAVIRIGITLPVLIIYGLAPRVDMLESLLMLGVVAVAGLGVVGVLRMRTWGILALAASAFAVAGSALVSSRFACLGQGVGLELPVTAGVLSLMLLACVAPFAVPIRRYLSR
jgi:hypothetical protein